MSNMSYCRWQNTFNDLRDCASALEEHESDPMNLSTEERAACEGVLATAVDMLEQIGVSVDCDSHELGRLIVKYLDASEYSA